VTTDEGTGIVHMAPGFGEDDHRVCLEHDIQVVCPVDHQGKFTSEVADYEGQLVFDANKPIIKALKERGVLVRHDTYAHNYPHCWRTDEPLIYKAISSWFVKVSSFTDRMVQLNEQINWIPDHVRDGSMGKWLAGARDWSISRNRFWGTPLPVWKSDDPKFPRVDVYGSLDEIERDFGVRPTDLHRPYIDELTRKNPDDPSGKATMRRVEDVLDCWFESGSMPFAQIHYPFEGGESREWFDHHFPADFIVEYIAQTRGWFYTLIVLATALFDKPPFKNVICHGVVLDENGQKLSKRLRNYPSPDEVFSTHGADALRWYLISSPILRGNNLSIDSKGRVFADVVRQSILPFWNAYSFFCLYANADEVEATARTDSPGVLDRYILAKTRGLVESVTERMDAYDIPGACAEISAFTDAMNNWYIRRSRERFWKHEKDQDKQDAYDTLYTVLTTVLRCAAPFLPMITEEIHRGLTGEESIHLTDWPDVAGFPQERDLVADMDLTRAVCSAALSVRKSHDLRTRLPLATLTVAGADVDRLEPYFDLIRDEINVKQVALSKDLGDLGAFVLKVNAALVGPRLGPDMKKVMAASRQGKWSPNDDGTMDVDGVTLDADEFELRLQSKDGVASQPLPGNRVIVALDTQVTPELEREGTARDLVRLIQQARKDARLDISDRIRLDLDLADPAGKAAAAAEAHGDYIREQTLADDLTLGAGSGEHVTSSDLDGSKVTIGLSRVQS